MAKSKTIAKADTTLANDPQLKAVLSANGWTETPIISSDHHGPKTEDFIVFSRAIQNPNFFPNGTLGKNTLLPQPSNTPQNQGFSGVSTLGAKSPMGVTHSNLAPNPQMTTVEVDGLSVEGQRIWDELELSFDERETGIINWPAMRLSYDISRGVFTVPAGSKYDPTPVPSQNLPAVQSNQLVTKMSDITSIHRMQSSDPSFVLAFDSEFYYEASGQRRVLSWQFAFTDPSFPAEVQELLVFAKTDKTLPFSMILNYILSTYRIYEQFVPEVGGAGFPYYRTRRWEVPVVDRLGRTVRKLFSEFDEAMTKCCDDQVKAAFLKAGPRCKADFDYQLDSDGHTVKVAKNAVNDYAIGYVNVYAEANTKAVPVTLACHTGSADITTLSFGSSYEKDMLLRLTQIQGGLVTLKEYTMHNPTLEAFYNFYPVRLSVRDTMAHAPAKKKALSDLGDVVGVPKLEVPAPFSKNDMLTFMQQDLTDFSEYAINDAVIVLLYTAELWGTNTAMPPTVSSAAAKAAVPVIQEYFGVSPKDREAYNRLYRGLRTVSRGLVPRNDKFGFIQNTSLEPVSADAEIIQLFAKNSYKGGYNASIRIGYYTDMTYDYDLENAYPTCMVLVPDVDWDNCIAFEVQNQPLTRMMVRTPFEPVFAYVTFEFPESVRFPCIPISHNGSMVFPRTSGDLDGVYVSCPELYLALMLGAKVFCKRLYVANVRINPDGTPSHSLLAVVRQFVNDRTMAQRIFGKGSVPDLLLKNGVNSLYGKTAQNVVDKHSWSAMSEQMTDIGGSPITSPVHASLTTAGVRCVLLAALNQVEDLNYRCFSVTTDGFISDVPEDVLKGLDLYGFKRYFEQSRIALVGDPTMWAVKHHQDDLVNLTTRGNASLSPHGVMAHNSYTTGAVPDSYEDRYEFVTAVLKRDGSLLSVNKSFAKFKEMARRENRIDFFVSDQERYISMDFDLKRKPVESSMRTVNPMLEDKDTGVVSVYEIANFDTVPYEDIAEFERWKGVGRGMDVLRTKEHWALYFDKIRGKQGGSRRQIVDLEWSKLVSAVMAYRLGVPLAGLGDRPPVFPVLDAPSKGPKGTTIVSVGEKVAWINLFNRSKRVFTVNNWKDSRKQNRLSQMLPEPVFIDLVKEMLAWQPAAGTDDGEEV